MIVHLMALFLAGVLQQPQEAPALECHAGPVERAFGGTDWLVYGCSDHSTFVVVSETGSPAMPFVFIVQLAGQQPGISGEGTGDQAATSAAFEDLKSLSVEDLRRLNAQTHSGERR